MTLKKVHVYKSVLEKILREHNTDFSSVSEKLGYEKSFISVMFYEGGGVSAQMPIPFVISMSNLLAVKYEAFLEVPRYDDFLGMDRVMKMFFDDCLVVNNSSFPKPRTERLKLYRRYETFCDDKGITPKSRNAFYAFLRERFREVKHIICSLLTELNLLYGSVFDKKSLSILADSVLFISISFEVKQNFLFFFCFLIFFFCVKGLVTSITG